MGQEKSEGFDSFEDAAAFFVLEYWENQRFSSNPPAYPIWSQSHGNQAVVVLGITSIDPSLAVLCRRDAIAWVPRDWTYGFGVLKGELQVGNAVVPCCWKMVGAQTEPAKVVWKDDELPSAKIDGHLYSAIWLSNRGSSAASWKPGEFCVLMGDRVVWDAALQRSWLTELLATPADFAQAYERYYHSKSDDDWWAVDVLFNCATKEEKLEAVWVLLEAVTDFKEQKDYLYSIGAGPLEDLMSGWLLDQISAELHDARLLTALSCVRMESESPELQARFSGMVRPFLPKVRETFLINGEVPSKAESRPKKTAGTLKAQRIGQARF